MSSRQGGVIRQGFGRGGRRRDGGKGYKEYYLWYYVFIFPWNFTSVFDPQITIKTVCRKWMILLKLINPDLHVRLINENTNILHRSTMTLGQKLALVNMISVTAFIGVIFPYCLSFHFEHFILRYRQKHDKVKPLLRDTKLTKLNYYYHILHF